jgi:hypothetical protein
MPALVYLLVPPLRDTSTDVRKAAARALRRTAEILLDTVPQPDWDASRRQEYDLSRREMVRGLREGLRTFDQHYRLEVVQAAFWFMADFGDEIWELVGSQRTHCGQYAVERLGDWSSPRIARFLVAALAKPGWWFAAKQCLARWNSLESVVALFEQSDLLQDKEICRRLRGMDDVRWFELLGDHLEALPAYLRPRVPEWLHHLGLPAQHKTKLLNVWVHAPDPELQRAAVYGLGRLGGSEATRRLDELATHDSTVGTFARWLLAGKRATPGRRLSTPREPADPGSSIATPQPAGEQPAPLEAETAWAELRRQTLARDDALMETIRAQLGEWEPHLVERMASSDAGDRLLALRVVAGMPLSASLRESVERLAGGDTRPAIRRIAAQVLVGAAGSLAAGAAPADDAAAGTAHVRAELRDLMSNLLLSDVDETQVNALVGELRELALQMGLCDPAAGEIYSSEPERNA